MGDAYDYYREPSVEDLRARIQARIDYRNKKQDELEAQQRQRKYVVGLAHDGSKMAFIKKNRPAWQAGLLNGIGGKVEELETFDGAMDREFREETGWQLPIAWRPLLTMTYPGQAVIAFYTALVGPEVLNGLCTATDEPVEVHSIEYPSLYPHLFIRNLHWIVPLALHEEEYDLIRVIGHTDPVEGDIVYNSTAPVQMRLF
jgi:8-oxo-dGTP diphosphatase